MTPDMIETGLVAFAAFFATIDPIGVAVVFAALTSGATVSRRRTMAFRGTAIAAGILLVFALFGDPLLKYMGITLPALRIAAGILLLLLAIDMVFARASGGRSTTEKTLGTAIPSHSRVSNTSDSEIKRVRASS